ncbi:MAG: YceH family protein [Rhodothermales bacterium]
MAPEASTAKLELSAPEVRVLGCLIEKELSTPDYYPMTVNALTAACNQKTNREPVVDYSESDVEDALEGLQRKRLVGHASSAYGRATKFRHALVEVMHLKRPHLAILASLMVRGPETVGEVRGRTTRMHEFETLEEVERVLGELGDWTPPLVAHLPRRPGQKEARYAHLLAGSVDLDTEIAPVTGTDQRLSELEAEVEALKGQMDDLRAAFDIFREQFE